MEARPSGKNVRRLSLLSGGERSLAALAYLFSVFRARPSPFYLMDEVEAALDDVNLHRFLDLVHEFRNEAQLLVVSHQKRTMEAADVLYGVSMPPGGSSRVVSQRIRDLQFEDVCRSPCSSASGRRRAGVRPGRGPWLCRWVGNDRTARARRTWRVLSPWMTVVLIVLGAVVANRLLRRVVRRAVTRWEQGGRTTMRPAAGAARCSRRSARRRGRAAAPARARPSARARELHVDHRVDRSRPR